MKEVLFFILIMASLTSFGQNESDIDLDIGIPDSLTFNKEIRIYKTSGPTNWTGIFRLYQNDNEKWNAEYYDHYAAIENVVELKTKKRKLKSKNLDLFWFKILATRIMDLPDKSEIDWKLNKPKITKDRFGNNTLMLEKTTVFDGEGYFVEIKSGNQYNQVHYGNPEILLEKYPKVDELQYFMEMIHLIQSELGVLE